MSPEVPRLAAHPEEKNLLETACSSFMALARGTLMASEHQEAKSRSLSIHSSARLSGLRTAQLLVLDFSAVLHYKPQA